MLSRWLPRLAISLGSIILVWLSLLVLDHRMNSNLVVVLLLLLLVALTVGALSGLILGCIDAVVFVLLVNWYLIPPVHTLAIESAESLVALFTFTVAAISASILTERVSRARAISALSMAQTELISRVVEEPTAVAALKQFRDALGLDSAHLGRYGSDGKFIPFRSDPSTTFPSDQSPVIETSALDIYRILGFGQARMAISTTFVDSLATAVARAYESELLQDEQANSLRLLELDRTRTALLASLGHDLRTPLSTIRVAAETLDASMAALDTHDIQELVTTIQISSKRLDGLVTNLLDLSRIQSGALICAPIFADIQIILDQSIAEVGSDLIVNSEVVTPIPAWCDPGLLERVLVNVISNAVIHQRSGSEIVVTCETSHESTTIKVVDQGIGIPSSQRALAMQPFSQIGNFRDGGTGVGLYIADTFTRSMGGTLTLDETPGGGLTVRINLPVRKLT